MNLETVSNKTLIMVIAVALVIAAAGYWYFVVRPAKTPLPASQGTATVTPPQDADLGSNLYEKSSNPVQDKLPGTVAPITNPIQNLYKNPFE